MAVDKLKNVCIVKSEMINIKRFGNYMFVLANTAAHAKIPNGARVGFYPVVGYKRNMLSGYICVGKWLAQFYPATLEIRS